MLAWVAFIVATGAIGRYPVLGWMLGILALVVVLSLRGAGKHEVPVVQSIGGTLGG